MYIKTGIPQSHIPSTYVQYMQGPSPTHTTTTYMPDLHARQQVSTKEKPRKKKFLKN